MVKIGKPFWHREYEREHYLYVLCVIVGNVRVELAGVQWAYSNSDGGWSIAEVGYTVPLKNGWVSVDGEIYKTATQAKAKAELLLLQILQRI